MGSKRRKKREREQRRREASRRPEARARSEEQGRFEALRRQMDESGLLAGREAIFDELPEERKMSRVLLDFIDPYQDLAVSDEAEERLITLGVIAWNVAMFSADEQKRALREVTATATLGDAVVMRQLLDELIERKRQHFADNRRFIADYTITDVGDELRLTVASLPPRER
jgi:hypothetical protein